MKQSISPFNHMRKLIKARTMSNINGTSIKEELVRFFQSKSYEGFRTWEGFTWGISNEQWFGLIPHYAGPYLTGSLISIFENEPFVVRDYPVLPPYEEHDTFLFKTFRPVIKEIPDNLSEYVVHPKINGAEVRFFINPSDMFWGKTRFIEYVDRNSGYNMNFLVLLELSGYADKVEKLCRDHGVMVMGSLFGKYIQGGYHVYECESDFRAYDLVDLATDDFLPWDKTQQLLNEYGIPCIDVLDSTDDILSMVESEGGVYFKKYLPHNEISIHEMCPEKEDKSEAQELLTLWNDT